MDKKESMMETPHELNDSYITNLNIIKDDTDKEISRFSALAQLADKKNENNRIYPKEILLNALDKVQKEIKKGNVFAMVDHPDPWSGVSVGRVGAIITNATFDNDRNAIFIEGEFVKNKVFYDELLPLIKTIKRVGISARGYGSSTYDKKRKAFIIGDDYEIRGWDFVLEPAVKTAKIKKVENKNNNGLKEDFNMNGKEEIIRTVDGLRSAYPELVAKFDNKINDATKANEDLTTKLTDAELKITELETELQEKTKMIQESTEKVTELTNKVANLEQEKANAEYKAAVTKLMSNHQYKDDIEIPDYIKTIEDATAYVEKETKRLDEFAKKIKKSLSENNDSEEKFDEIDPKGIQDSEKESQPTRDYQDEYLAMLGV